MPLRRFFSEVLLAREFLRSQVVTAKHLGRRESTIKNGTLCNALMGIQSLFGGAVIDRQVKDLWFLLQNVCDDGLILPMIN
jgi:hypothetical protein